MRKSFFSRGIVLLALFSFVFPGNPILAQGEDFSGQEQHRMLLRQVREEKQMIDEMALDNWRIRAVAWAKIHLEGAKAAWIDESEQVLRIETKGTVKGDRADGWEIEAAKKLKGLKLVIPLHGTGDKGKAVVCDLKPIAEGAGEGYLGIFMLADGGFHCLNRSGLG